MASFSGDAEGSTEDITGRKKSKLRSLKTRLFGRSKRGSSKKNPKLSQSESDITSGKGLGSEEDLSCPTGMMASRALSHDSIFLDDQVLKEAEPDRVSSQENVQGRIKALQKKLQQQKMHLGPPPLVLPIRRPEDPESRSDEENLSGSLAETSTSPISPVPKPSPTKYALPPPNSSADESPSDFSSPAQLTPRLDTSAARHRMSVKPRNQRAGSKKKIGDADLNNIDHPDSDSEKELQSETQEEETPETQGVTISPVTSQLLPSKLPEVVPVTSEVETKPVSSTPFQPGPPPTEAAPALPSKVLRVKTHRTGDAVSSERPHSCFLPSEIKDRREAGFELDVMFHDKKHAPNKAEQLSSTTGSEETPRSTSPKQQDNTEGSKVIKRSTQGSGSFHFSVTVGKNRDGERPRSGSFAGVLEKTEGRHRYEKKPIVSAKEKEELRELQLRGAGSAAARLRQTGTVQKSSDFLLDKRESLKKVESATPSTGVTSDADAVKTEEVKEEVQKQEDDGKVAFGVKLRSTSQSLRYRSEGSSNQNTAGSEEQSEKRKAEEVGNNISNKSRKMTTDSIISGDLRQADATIPCLSPVKKSPPSADYPHTEVQSTPKVENSTFGLREGEIIPAAPQEPAPTPQSASSEVSWMSLAMEKTKSIQQLFNRFPRDFSGAPPRPQGQVPPASPVVQTQTQTVKVQQSTMPLEAAKQPPPDAVRAETAQSKSQTQAVKPSLVAVQQKTSAAPPVKANTPKEPATSKQTSQPQLIAAPSASAVKTNPSAAQSMLLSSAKTQTSQSAQGGAAQSLAQSYLSSAQQQQQQQQPPWSSRAPPQVKSTTPAPVPAPSPAPSPAAVSPTSSASPAPESAPGGEKETAEQEKESVPLSVSQRAAFLEKRAERITPPAAKPVELKKTEAPTPSETPASPKTPTLVKDTKPEGRQWAKPAESSPMPIPERPREDKWPRKNVVSSPARSLSPTVPSPLQSMSESGQPSWMELAKRKSMAWSDKSMD